MQSDLKTNRLAALVALASAAPGQTIGRTAAMKLLYFLQELHGVPLGYDFRIHTYGPYDAEVLTDLGTAQTVDALTEKTVMYNVGYGYAIKPGPKAEAVKAQAADWLKANQTALDAVIQEFGACTASDLELSSTVLFVDREFHAAQARPCSTRWPEEFTRSSRTSPSRWSPIGSSSSRRRDGCKAFRR